MSNKSIKRVLDLLIAIKASMHDVAETGVNEKLDEAIELLEVYVRDGRCDNATADEVIVIVGKVLEKLPSIVSLLKLFSD